MKTQNKHRSQLVVSLCLVILGACFAWFDLRTPSLNGWPVVMAWLTVLTGWGLFVGVLIRKYRD